MSSDLSDQIQDAIDWAIRAISSLGFLIPIAIFLVANLFSRKDKAKQNDRPAPNRPSPPQTRPQTAVPEFDSIPAGPFAWIEPDTAPSASTPARADRDDPYRHEDSSLQWGSAFAANDAEKAGSAFKWGSAFDDHREQVKWGWDESEWGGDYAQKRDSEPKITVG